MADNSAAIAAIDAILDAGITKDTVTVDGQTSAITYDFDALRRKRAELQAEDDNTKARNKRPPIVTAKLGF